MAPEDRGFEHKFSKLQKVRDHITMEEFRCGPFLVDGRLRLLRGGQYMVSRRYRET